MNDTVKEN